MPKSTYTVRGNLGAAPELRHSPSGVPWATFSVCETDRRQDPRTGDWHDVSSTWWDVTCFRALAENVDRALTKGSPVVVRGTLEPSEWTSRDGVVHKSFRLVAGWVAYDLTRHPVDVRRVSEPPGGVGAEVAGGAGGAVVRSGALPGGPGATRWDSVPPQPSAPVEETFDTRPLAHHEAADALARGAADLDDLPDEELVDADGVLPDRGA